MNRIRGLLVVLALAAAASNPTVVAADATDEHRACPNDNPGQGLVRSTEASSGTSLKHALKGITRAIERVGCPTDGPFEDA